MGEAAVSNLKVIHNNDTILKIANLDNCSTTGPLQVVASLDQAIASPQDQMRHLLIKKALPSAGIAYELISIFNENVYKNDITLVLRNSDRKTVLAPILAADDPGFSDIVR